MGNGIPFLRPNVVPLAAYAHYVETIDASHIYSNNGPLCREFETRLVADLFSHEDSAVAVSNATTGLMLAIAAVKRPKARYAVMPSFTFAATPLAAQWAGLEPYFVDIEPDSWVASFAKVSEAVTSLGDDVAVVVPYATFGSGVDLTGYAQLQRAGVPVVVDAAASLGCSVDGLNFGARCPFPVVFSMHATKAFPVGEGGVVVSSNVDIVEKVRAGANFGFDADRRSQWSGFNAKLPEISCAIALATLDAFGDRVRVRRVLDQQYRLQLPSQHGGGAWLPQSVSGTITPQFFPVLAPDGPSRDAAVARLETQSIQARTYFSPACHQQPAFAYCAKDTLPVTEDLSRRILSLPLWEGMSSEDVHRCVTALLGD